MERFTTLLRPADPGEPSVVLSLSHEQRRRAKLRVELPDGVAVGLSLPRGLSLKDGDRLLAEETGKVARVKAQPEHLSVVETQDTLLLARAAYHLGNRHVAVQVCAGSLRYLRDHVLDDMVRGLGLAVIGSTLPFEPEGGAYAHAGTHGGHTHGHA